jgi:hypothetical protein
MARANQRTLDVDKIFVRDIIFKDASNRPIEGNKFLITRGDGGTYFGNMPFNSNSTMQGAFNEFRAGSNLIFTASNFKNTLWFEPGSGIQFTSTIDGGQPRLWIAATAPEQIRVTDKGALPFSSLEDELVGGRTLTFTAQDDMLINISDNTLVFSTKNASTFSSVMSLNSTTVGMYETTSTMLFAVDTLLMSTAVSSFYSTLTSTEEIAAQLSSLVNSAFTPSSSAGSTDPNAPNDTITFNYPLVNISSLTVDQINGGAGIFTQISTFSTIYWSTGFGKHTDLSSLTVSTIMGADELPIITFDKENHRIGINLGANKMPRATVDVSGIVYAKNFVNSSDRRLKTALEPLRAREVPAAYRFSWISNNEVDVGCMADEVERIVPECVTTCADGYKAVNYAKLVPYCFSLIADLQARVDSLEREKRYGGAAAAPRI